MRLFCVCFLLVQLSSAVFGLGEVIFALNAGGDAFTDSFGIRYRKDYLAEGTPSDYGKNLDIKRIWDGDKYLYETERYHTDSFGYTVPLPAGDGDYVLWLKFCEVWFNGVNLKVFDVALNDQIVIEELDIFAKVGRGVAQDEIVPFQVRSNKLIINGKTTAFNNEIRVDFLKGAHDNPKVNAIIVLKGSPEQVPELPEYVPKLSKVLRDEDEYDEAPIADVDDEEEEEDEDEELIGKKNQRQQREADPSDIPRKPKVNFQQSEEDIVVDPYASDDTYLIPILVALGAFIPLLFCLCKL